MRQDCQDDVEQSGTAKLTMRLNHEQANRLLGITIMTEILTILDS